MGRNGSGKSTLLSQLAGVRPPTSGSVDVSRGATRPRLAPRALVARVGLVPQDAGVLLYGESVAEECAGADHDTGLAPGTTAAVLERVLPGLPRGPAPPGPVRGTAAGPGPGHRARPGAPAPAPRRAHPGTRLSRERPGWSASWPSWPPDGHAVVAGHPRRGAGRPGGDPGGGAGRGRGGGRRPGPRRGLPLAGVRPPGGQGAGPRSLAHRRRGPGRPRGEPVGG